MEASEVEELPPDHQPGPGADVHDDEATEPLEDGADPEDDAEPTP